jgi:prepilin-type N-terminal cleavage/methylation domain-containing protein
MVKWPALSSTEKGEFMRVHKRQDGFTLVEVLVSISLLSIALLGLCGATVMAMKGNSLSQMSTKATVMAKDKMEGLKNLNYTQIASGSDTLEANYYTRQWTVTTVTPDVSIPDNTYKTVAVTVSWTWQSLARNVTLNTIITK